jgi:hypothetical protein
VFWWSRSNEMEISHGRVAWQTHRTYFEMRPILLAGPFDVGFIDWLDLYTAFLIAAAKL